MTKAQMFDQQAKALAEMSAESAAHRKLEKEVERIKNERNNNERNSKSGNHERIS